MSDRIKLNEEMLEEVIGGTITFDWDGRNGHCGLNGDKSYNFDSREEFIAAVKQCHRDGLTDAECLQSLIQNGIIQ